MELIRAIREGQVGDVIAVYSSDKGSKTDIPKWIEKAGHRLVALEARDGYDEIVVEKRAVGPMHRILILGGGVGGTLTANLLVKKLRPRIEAREVESRSSTRPASTSTSPGSCTSRWAANAREPFTARSAAPRRAGPPGHR